MSAAESELRILLAMMSGAKREHTDVKELAERLRRPPSEILRVLELHNIQMASWSEPSAYRIADILEVLTRHEVAARYNRA